MPRGRKHYLLYARQNWRDSRVLVAVIALGYTGIGVYDLLRHDVAGAFTFLLPAPLALIFLPLLYGWTKINYVTFDDDGIFIRIFMRRTTVPWEQVERGRLETMQKIFELPERKRLRTGIVRRLYREQAVCVRVREDDADLLRRRLGARTIPARELVLPVTDGDGAMAEIKLQLTAHRRQEQAEAAAQRRGAPGGRRRRR
ncbi:MAG TPA: hypothetical protein VG245_06260 [Candidatus Dormibacteraeota bacterium]|jgi:hypothetical protein|nr:hypothetical protein [Candidatus Dormibacteraeota bacterium]